MLDIMGALVPKATTSQGHSPSGTEARLIALKRLGNTKPIRRYECPQLSLWRHAIPHFPSVTGPQGTVLKPTTWRNPSVYQPLPRFTDFQHWLYLLVPEAMKAARVHIHPLEEPIGR